MTIILNIKNVSLRYHQKPHQFIFVDLNLQLEQGKWSALLGPSGVGKTSLLRMIAGLLTQDEEVHGEISFHTAVNPDPKCNASANIAYMAQQDLLLPWLTVLENTLLNTKLRYFSRQKYIAQKEKALTLLQQVGLKDALHLYPHQLSGGMRQRTALARTLLEDKNIILMDEPFSSLDAITRYKLQNLAAKLLKDKTVLFITHDPSESLRLAHQIYLMQGTPATLRNLATLQSSPPRHRNDPEVINQEALLFAEFASE